MSIAPYSSVTLQFPSDRGDRFGKALGRADVVVFDLEEAIVPTGKSPRVPRARQWLRSFRIC